MRTGIIGAGMAGIIAAITAAKNGNKVILIEHGDKIGKKILSTGNGRCNITNEDMKTSHFHGSNPKFADGILRRFDNKDTVQFFNELGMLLKNKNGYYYPYCEQAVAVLDVLNFEIEKYSDNIKLILNCNVQRIDKKDSFIISTDKGDINVDKLIIACGSMAASKTGSDGSGYNIAKQLGHNIIKPLPALTSLISKDRSLNTLAGIRTEAKITLVINNKTVTEQIGELQLNKDSISGIPVFQLSFLAARALDEGKCVNALIDFLPGLSNDEVRNIINKRIEHNSNIRIKDLFVGTLHKNISYVIAKRSSSDTEKTLKNMRDSDIEKIIYNLKNYDFEIADTNSFDKAQTCTGGIDTDELTENLESKIHKNLYFAGEIIDINGDCGGYNLQWAISTGAICGGFDYDKNK